MRRTSLFPAAFIAFFCTQNLTPAEGTAVRVWQDSIHLPTYREGDADPNPQFAAYGGDTVNYPYAVRMNFTKDRQDRVWRTLNLENEYLVCRVLPDLGGHLYSCRDKRNGREMFYANPVIKTAAIGLRGAWAALGIESNFPAGHTRTTVSPVDFAIRGESNGSGRVLVEEIDRITGMQWRVEFVLRPGSTVLEQRVTLYNRSHTRWPYYWWASAAVPLDDPAMKFILPSRLVASHSIENIDSWPINSAGKDESQLKNHKESGAWFAYRCREPFLAVYNPGSRAGVAHFADPNIVQGKKVWFWGSESDANYVRRELTDNFSSYIEIQGGLFENQETFEFLEPEQSRTFSDYWIPIHDLGGVSRVTADAVVNLERRSDRTTGPVLALELSVTRAVKDGVIRVMSEGQTAFETRADLNPAATYSHVLEKPGAAPYTIQLADSQGSILLEHTERRYDAGAPEEVKLGKQPRTDWNSPEQTESFLLARGNFNELHQQWHFALNDYKIGLKRFPSSLPLETAAGRLALGLNRFEEAADLLAKVRLAAPSDEETAYYLGIAQAMLGHDAEARRALEQVAATSAFGPAAALQLARLAARAKDDVGALAALKKIPGARAGALEVALLRRSGHKEEALRKLAQWRALDPADSMLRFEDTLLEADDPELWKHLAADSERVVNLADEYLNLGMYDDARRVLRHPYPAIPPDQLEPGAVPPAQSPMVGYYRAFCGARLGELDPAELKTASESSVRYAFPYRPSSFAVLKSALTADPSDATARLLLGRLYLHGLKADEAIAEWQKARATNARIPELYRDLSRALIQLKGDAAGGLAALSAGLKLDSDNTELRTALERAGGNLTALTGGPRSSTSALSPLSASPIEVATAAMVKSASGVPEDAARMFDPKVFSAEKQPDEVRRAYIEVQLQRLIAETRSGACLAIIDRLDRLGNEDGALTFTMYGFNNFIKPAHFQYYMSVVEAFCHDEKSARKRWSKISKMNESLPSPEFVFPILAAWKLSAADAKSRVAGALDSVRGALAKTEGESRFPLTYIEGMLLRMSGQEEQAAQRLQEVAKSSQDPQLRYMALVGLREMFGR